MARFLLDTHVVLWALAEPAKLARPARTVIEDARNEVLVSVVSAWEIAIKRALGKLEAPDDLEAAIRTQGFEPLLCSTMRRILTRDPNISLYGVRTFHCAAPSRRGGGTRAEHEAIVLTDGLATRDPNISLYVVRTLAG